MRRGRRNAAFLTFVVAVCILTSCTSPNADDPPHEFLMRKKSDFPVRPSPQYPYCGIYSLYFILQSAKYDVSLDDMLKNTTLTANGTSLFDLQQIASSCGAFAVPLEGLDRTFISTSPFPIILQVKTRITLSSFDHFVVYLGRAGKEAIIYDPPDRLYCEPFDELESSLSGRGMVVCADSLKWDEYCVAFRASTWGKRIFVMSTTSVCITLAIVLANGTKRRWQRGMLTAARNRSTSAAD
jgi:ABC-type bacteriocin/lantibiotic exporter with double-glycine peptidase domain